MSGVNKQKKKNTKTLFHRQSGKCFYCDTPTYLFHTQSDCYRRDHPTTLATFDHIKVKSKFGSCALANGVCACQLCNSMRGNLDQKIFINNFAYIQAEWQNNNRHITVSNGVVNCLSLKLRRKANRQRKKEKQNQRIARQHARHNAGFLTKFYKKFGKIAKDLFTKSVYNTRTN